MCSLNENNKKSFYRFTRRWEKFYERNSNYINKTVSQVDHSSMQTDKDLPRISELKDLESQFSAGAISELDFDSVKVRVENCKLNIEIIEVYVWLYEVLCEINL